MQKNQLEILKRTKIITTIGPATDSKESMIKLFECGMNTVRLNFSHGTYDEHVQRIKWAKEASKELDRPISTMLDTKGPEIRVGKMESGGQMIAKNTEVIVKSNLIDYKNLLGTSKEITVSYDMSNDLKAGQKILLDDGKLILDIKSVEPGLIRTIAVNNHLLKTNKRINLPGVALSMPFLSDKDKQDIKFGIENGVDYIAASFVNSVHDILQIRKILEIYNNTTIRIIAKIESQLGVDNIDSIIKAADSIMIARGDLGLEVPYYEVPGFEKLCIRKCLEAGKPVIVATQMLESMLENPSPTRAEVTDVFFATELGADATMLSGESAVGEFPFEAVKIMSRINVTAERYFFRKGYYEKFLKKALETTKDKVRANIAYNLALKCQEGAYRFTIVVSRSGNLLDVVSKMRINSLTIGIVDESNLKTCYGISNGIFLNLIDNMDEINDVLLNKIAKKWGAQVGEKILFARRDTVRELVII